MLISWNITKACNLECEHCYRDAGLAQKDELTLDEGKKLLSDLKELGFKIVIFSGGEPLLRAELFDWIKFAKSLGLISVLGTNGTLLDSDCAQKLKQSGLKRAGISLDSIDPSRHDAFRQVKGCWQKSIDAMKYCKDAGLEFQIHTTVTTKNINEILEITDLAQSLGAAAQHIFFLVPTGRGKNIDSVIPAAKEYERLLGEILEKQKTVNLELKPVCAPQFMRIAAEKKIKTRFNKGCLSGISYACILPNGDVHPCPYMPIYLGNAREQGIKKIWRESKVLNDLRKMDWQGKCGICEYKKMCSGCRATAYFQSNGNYLGEDTNCNYEPKRKKDSQSIAI
ncbi:MAG: radical SAM protein [Candidatus Omnitrophota bacterium]